MTYLWCFGEHDAFALAGIIRLDYVSFVLLRAVVRHKVTVAVK